MPDIEKRLNDALEKRIQSHTLRKLTIPHRGIDFYSNDYLGLTRNHTFKTILVNEVQASPHLLMGSTGSRLVSGNSPCTVAVEAFIANEHRVEAALLFSAGFTANLALLSCVPQRGDTILLDEYVHRSVRDGARLSPANCYKFRHNNLNHLEELLKKANGTVFIAVESLYSMEGDFAPLEAIAQLAMRYRAALIVDEAHAFAVFGYGLVMQLQLQHKVFATIVTYGKAMGLHGAAILGSKILIAYLVNYAAAFIYTTALTNWHAVSIQKGYEFLAQQPALSKVLQQRIATFSLAIPSPVSAANSPIQIVVTKNNAVTKALQKELEKQQLLTFAVVAPTVKAGRERLRICLHAFNTTPEIEQLTHALHKYLTL